MPLLTEVDRYGQRVVHSTLSILWQRVYAVALAHTQLSKRVPMDFDATAPLHGMLKGCHWHGHCRCYLRLYVFAEERPLATVLQPSDQNVAWQVGAVVAPVGKALRAE